MRIPIVAGNWKMHKTVGQARQLVYELKTDLETVQGVDRVLCPTFPALMAVHELLADSAIELGAQNLHWEPSGAFTGEISAEMLAEFCEYVIIGHSERRAMFGETDDTVNLKVKSALAAGLVPIVCVGETLAENQSGQTHAVVSSQLTGGLQGLTAAQVAGLVIAYEPVWAIGSGLPATPEGANQIISESIRGPLTQFGAETAQAVRVQYGGSVKPGNAHDFFAQPDIDGALVGGASLTAANFVPIVRAAAARLD
jgi:triosephosphate isomerase